MPGILPMSDNRDSIAEKLRTVLAKLTDFEKTFDSPISEWAALYQQKLLLERELSAAPKDDN
jgi:hypothetical protein